MRLHLALAAIIVLSSCGADHSEEEVELCDTLRRELSRQPHKDAEDAIARGDLRFRAVEGITVTVPGVEDAALIERHGYIIMEGTTDAPTDRSCELYQLEATSYAEEYNTKVREMANRR